MRLDYAKVIPYIEYFSQKITDLISQQQDELQQDGTDEKKNDPSGWV
jgi:hypothetical protein